MRNMWKKFIAFFMCIFFVPFTFIGCGDKEDEIVYDFDKSGFFFCMFFLKTIYNLLTIC